MHQNEHPERLFIIVSEPISVIILLCKPSSGRFEAFWPPLIVGHDQDPSATFNGHNLPAYVLVSASGLLKTIIFSPDVIDRTQHTLTQLEQ
ncbi:MAG: hypothetical protein HUJ24_04350 [Rhodobacteraceae bacterium]|nr:hypothetical protein [Paracoccaceae bacterium]